MKYLVVIFFLFATVSTFAQSHDDRPVVQFTGVVHNADSSSVIVPYVSITNTSARNSVSLSNYKGYFSFVAHEQDTLRFTCVGYGPVTVVIPANVPNKSYTMQVSLKPQIINLPTFHVFPWATTDEFKKDFLSIKLADDDLEIARKNINRTTLVALSNVLPRDAQEIQSASAQSMHTSILNSHSLTPNPLLNPLAWGGLIKQITDSDNKSSN
ncbi:hypothetical protein SNE25_02455 [Mucilaginibacter sabulilitoris]|uniref:Carboxypeptidase-like regulatory domain-containing protein n=1 Tax=Mucilaginibacter sabulilitoris TaxID=1173583 RepID=A0ABZ0TQK2_9SPHI|nr:hypothetical protein [Mucilaginibacter sabulilitoris]WPU94383.1 hypothetical protein SNE25_02455 [Mucilaginibacter sabulilitoris]